MSADYRHDPHWISAFEQWTADVPGESAEAALSRRLDAVRGMHEIERRAELARMFAAGGGAG